MLFSLGCGNVPGAGSSTNSSQSACAGDGGLFPAPIGPQSFQAWQKFAIGGTTQRLRAGSPLVVIVNEQCVLSQPEESLALTQSLRSDVQAQSALLPERAYSLKPTRSYSVSELRSLASQDPCLVHLAEDRMVYRDATTVNDPNFANQIHLNTIEAPAAWDTFYSNISGEVVIAIIDDGIELTHSDLSGVLWTNAGEIAGNGVDDDGNGYVDDVRGYNFASNLGSPAHEAGSSHGTHVAGLAAAQDNNSIGVTGVMGRNAKIMALNVFGNQSGAGLAAIINALNYARAKGAKVINMSLGGPGSAATINTALVNAVAGGAFIAIAAGNDDELVSASNFYQPMGYAKDIQGAIAVGSIDATTSAKSSFSNHSTTYVEIAAPGSNTATGGVMSTYISNGYTYLQGTSMSSPVVAGSAALLIGWVQARGKTITPAQVESFLKSSANSSSALSPYFAGGASLNLKNLAATALCNF